MPLLDTVQKDMISAMKSKDEARLGALRMIKAALKKQEIDAMKPLDETGEMQVMNPLLKQRRKPAKMFRKGGGDKLAAKKEAKTQIIKPYPPPGPTPAEMKKAVSAAITETG